MNAFNRISSSRVLITGATGFIGEALTRSLIELGADVICLAFNSRGQLDRLSHFDKAEIIEIDSSGNASLKKLLHDVKPEFVFNLASAGVKLGERDFFSLIEGNKKLLNNLLSSVSADSLKLFVHTGSWSEYEPQEGKKLISEDCPLTYKAGYGGAKAQAMTMGLARAEHNGIPFVALRLFNVYGPGEGSHRLIPQLIQHLSLNDPIDLTPGDQVRDFVFIKDVVEAFLSICLIPDPTKGNVYNICTGIPLRVRQVAEEVVRQMRRPKSLLRFGGLPARTDEPEWIVGDGSKFRELTGWAPKTTIKEGIAKSIDYYLGAETTSNWSLD